MFKRLIATAMSILAVLLANTSQLPTAHAQSPSNAAADRCGALPNEDLSTVQDAPSSLNYGKVVAAAGELPTYCEVDGYVAPSVGFRMWLPDQWNGKLLQIGCGGSCGILDHIGACAAPMKRGYACIVTDMGHRNRIGTNLWAYNNPQAQIDYGFRATYVTAIAGKEIVKRYYGNSATKSYHQGCSAGGWQGLVMAQRFPGVFDGIIAGCPLLSWSDFTIQTIWLTRAIRGDNNQLLLDKDSVTLLHDQAISQCDEDDGLKDGIIGNPATCKFDPAVLQCKAGQSDHCLNPEQIAAAKKLYSRPVDSSGDPIASSGLTPGSELSVLGPIFAASSRLDDAFRYLAFMPAAGPSWKMKDFDFDRDPMRLGVAETLFGTSNPDLRQFNARGAKIILYGAWDDAGTKAGPLIEYFNNVKAVMGGEEETRRFARLFVVPGMDHCGYGGGGPSQIDYLTYLEQWVEEGRAPDVIVGRHVRKQEAASEDPRGMEYRRLTSRAGTAEYSRPIFAYPLEARYKGSGDPAEASNFVPVDPSKSSRKR